MYQSVYNTKDLKQKDISQIFTNILVNTGNKVVSKFNYDIVSPINITTFLAIKNLLPFALFIEDDINTKECCLQLTTEQLLTKLYNNFSSLNPGKGKSDNWVCTTSYCSTPQGLYVSYITNTSALVGWDMVFGETYNVYVNEFLIASNATSPVAITDLTEGTVYTIRISSGENESCNSTINFTTTSEQPNLVFSWNKSYGEVVNLLGKVNGTFTKVDWGDGTINTLLTHTYTSDNNFTVKFYSTTTTILLIGNKLGTSVYNVTEVTIIPSTLVTLNVGSNFLTSLPSLAPLTGLVTLIVNRNQLTSLNISANTLLDQVIMSDNLVAGVWDIHTNTVLTWMEADRNKFTGATGVASCPLLKLYQVGDNKIGVTAVNNILIALNAGGLLNGRCVTSGQTPVAAPTGAGIVAAAALVANGWTVTTD